VVRALAAVVVLGVVPGGDLVRIAAVVPVAVVVAGARVLIEVAVRLAGRVVLARDAAVVAVFRVVARPEAVGVLGVDLPVAIVVEAVAARVEVALAQDLNAGSAAR
jgi:hypothetical protein